MPEPTALAAFYEQRAAEEPASDPEALLRFDKAIAAAALRPGERVLDIGAKWGGLASRLQVDVAYTGLDLSEENVRKAAAAGLDIRHADVTKPLPVDDGAFDCVFCLELLEHLTFPLALLEELRRVLSLDGRASSPCRARTAGSRSTAALRRHDPRAISTRHDAGHDNLAALAGFRVERGWHVRRIPRRCGSSDRLDPRAVADVRPPPVRSRRLRGTRAELEA